MKFFLIKSIIIIVVELVLVSIYPNLIVITGVMRMPPGDGAIGTGLTIVITAVGCVALLNILFFSFLIVSHFYKSSICLYLFALFSAILCGGWTYLFFAMEGISLMDERERLIISNATYFTGLLILLCLISKYNWVNKRVELTR